MTNVEFSDKLNLQLVGSELTIWPPRINQYVNSPYTFNTLPSGQVMRIGKIVN